MPEEVYVYGRYCILHLFADEPGYKAGIAIKSGERNENSHYYFINAYEGDVVAARVKKMLPWITTPDYVEYFECGQTLVLVFRHAEGTTLDECIKTCGSIAERLELIRKSVIFVISQHEHFPVAMLSCLLKPSLILHDGNQMRFVHIIQFKGEYPYDIRELMPYFGRFISECLPSVCKRHKRVKRFIERCERKTFDGITGLVSDFTDIITALTKKYGRRDNFNIYNKYSDILQGYVPVKKKRKPVLAVVVVILLIIAACFAYVYFLPERDFFIWNNSDILKAVKNLISR
ncbi:MAG: hypothetical protein GX494_09735 [Clostridiaceae bacterium]|nr:hypothetical protein [Clostridiaceae bacterium]